MTNLTPATERTLPAQGIPTIRRSSSLLLIVAPIPLSNPTFDAALKQAKVREQIESNGSNVRPSANPHDYEQDFVKEMAFTQTMMKVAKLNPV